MEIKFSNSDDALKFVKRAVFLAFNASRPFGAGFLQSSKVQREDLSEEKVWDQAYNEKDYCSRNTSDACRVNCDYVFGRMMKFRMKWKGDIVNMLNNDYRGDYQSFAGTYSNNEELAKAVIDSLGIKARILENVPKA